VIVGGGMGVSDGTDTGRPPEESAVSGVGNGISVKDDAEVVLALVAAINVFIASTMLSVGAVCVGVDCGFCHSCTNGAPITLIAAAHNAKKPPIIATVIAVFGLLSSLFIRNLPEVIIYIHLISNFRQFLSAIQDVNFDINPFMVF